METELDSVLRKAGLRATAGRVAVLDTLDILPHTDAERIYRAVSTVLPTTSIQTAGLIRRIEPAGSAALYERRIGDN